MSGNRTRILRVAAVFLAGLWGSAGVYAAEYDVLLRGGSVIDGSGQPAFEADVAIDGTRIAAVGNLADRDADRIIDATGLTVVPGFVDLHSHADGGGESGGLRSRQARRRAAPNLVAQGVTTVVVNQDGRSMIDIARQRRQLEERGFGPNVVLMVGHNTIRRAALRGSDTRRPATPAEIGTMQAMLREGVEAGAWGLTAGLEYEPGVWSTTDELIALVGELASYNGVYIVHERASGRDPMWYLPSRHGDLGDPSTMLDSILETIEVAEATGVTSVATHIKARGQAYWGMSEEMVAAIQAARDRGVPIFADQYPYATSGSDGTIALIPHWVLDEHEGPSDDYFGALVRALSDDGTAARMAKDVIHIIMRRGGPGNIVILDHPNRDLVGKTLEDAASERGITPVEMAYLLQLKGYKDQFGGATVRGFSMDEEDVRRFAVQPWTATASDAGVTLPGDGFVHARHHGAFPRKLRRYALSEDAVMSVERAVRSMSGLPADILDLDDRGYLREGYVADVAVLDLRRVRDTATFFEPHQYPEGIPFVFINGQVAVDDGAITGAFAGRVLTRENDRVRRDTDD